MRWLTDGDQVHLEDRSIQMKRRQFLSLGTALVALAATGLPQRTLAAGSDVLAIGGQTEYLPLNPESARSRFYTSAEISETLVWLDYDMVLQPCLATAWERVSPLT